jgi:hypothetical protein
MKPTANVAAGAENTPKQLKIKKSSTRKKKFNSKESKQQIDLWGFQDQ